MPLVSMSQVLRKAREARYGVGHFEAWNLESARAIITAANEERSPAIFGFNGTLIDERRRDLEYYAAIGKVVAWKAHVPVALILNEASSFEQIVQGIHYGFSSVMIDGSSLPFEDNVRLTRKVVDVAHSLGVSVEGQVDELPHAKNGTLSKRPEKGQMTDPAGACEFVNQTGIDALSVSVGNVHVLYREHAQIDFQRVEELAEVVDVPLVIHGATGIEDDSVKKAVALGISKVNIGTALRYAFTHGMAMSIGEKSFVDPEQVLESGEQKLRELVRAKMRVYGSSGKAEPDG